MWSEPISVDQFEDLKIEYQLDTETTWEFDRQVLKKEALAENTEAADKEKEVPWFYPQYSNNNRMITRVMVTEHPSPYDATILIIMDEPFVSEYFVHNTTGFRFEYRKYDMKTKRPLEKEWNTILPNTKQTLTWDFRLVDRKAVQIKAMTFTKIIQLDKVGESADPDAPVS